MSEHHSHRRRRRVTPLILVTGLVSAMLLALATTGVISGFTASITNTQNTVATGTLLMQESGQTFTCLSTATTAQITTNAANCATINKFGLANTLSIPGSNYTTTIAIKNTGTVPASTFTLTPSGCTSTTPAIGTGSDAASCGKVQISIEDDTTTPSCVLGGAAGAACPATPTATLSSWTTALNLGTVAAGATKNYKFFVQIVGTADNTDQGLQASEPLVWAFAS